MNIKNQTNTLSLNINLKWEISIKKIVPSCCEFDHIHILCTMDDNNHDRDKWISQSQFTKKNVTNFQKKLYDIHSYGCCSSLNIRH